jgi:hypothetical protein
LFRDDQRQVRDLRLLNSGGHAGGENARHSRDAALHTLHSNAFRDLRVQAKVLQPAYFRPPLHEIHGLNGLACGAFDEVVESRRDNDHACSWIKEGRDLTEI